MPIDFSKADLSKYETFDQMTKDFKKGMGYAQVKLGDTDVFLVSTGTFTGEDGARYAMDASVFVYDRDGKIDYLGKVQSGGTAYPLMITDGYLFTGGHHNVTKWTVKNGRLEAAEEACETFDTDGNSTYYLGDKQVEDDTDLSRLFEEYFSGEEVDFTDK